MLGRIIPVQQVTPSSLPPLIGWNQPGGEMEDANIPGTQGANGGYLFPGYTTSSNFTQNDYGYAASKGINFMCVDFSWQQLQQTLGGSFNTTYLNQFQTSVAAALDTGAWVSIRGTANANQKTYAGYNGICIGHSGGPTNAQFADLWTRLTELYYQTPRIIFDLFNEPNNITFPQTSSQWFSAANAAIAAIRAAGGIMPIFVEGFDFASAATWMANSTDWTTLTDPINNLVACCHDYGDSFPFGFGGTYRNISSDGTGNTADNTAFASNLTKQWNGSSYSGTGMLQWAQANTYASGGNIRIFIGETGCSPSPQPSGANYTTAMTNLYNVIADNPGTMLGLAWWSGGASNNGWFAYNSTNGSGTAYCIASGTVGSDTVAYPCFEIFLPLITGS